MGTVGAGIVGARTSPPVLDGSIVRSNLASGVLPIALNSFNSEDYITLDANLSESENSNTSIVIAPKGNGSITTSVPDGTNINGNERGLYSVDLQLTRQVNYEVCGGNYSFITGHRNRLESDHSIAMGYRNSSTSTGFMRLSLIGGNNISGGEYGGEGGACLGVANVLSQRNCILIGNENQILKNSNNFDRGRHQSTIIIGAYNRCQQPGSINLSQGRFLNGSNTHDSIGKMLLQMWAETTDATETIAKVTQGNGANTGLNTLYDSLFNIDCVVTALADDGSSWAVFRRRIILRRGADYTTTSIVSTQSVGNDQGSNAGSPPAGWGVVFDVETSNPAPYGQAGNFYVKVTGASDKNIRWLVNNDIVLLHHPQ
jgi:hypothetical protein